MKEMTERFQKMEDDIMRVWSIVDDINLTLRMVDDSEVFANMSAEQADKLTNVLIGVKELSDYKVQLMWDNYVLLLRDYYKYYGNHDNKEYFGGTNNSKL